MILFDKRFKRYDNFRVDLDRLRAETYTLMYDYPNGVYHTQRSLQTDGSNDWTAGIGSKPDIDESIWDRLHPDLVGTWWEEFFASLPFKVYRARLLTLQARTCYSIHSDRTPRIHIAIDNLITYRLDEGGKLEQDVSSRINTISRLLNQIPPFAEERIIKVKKICV